MVLKCSKDGLLSCHNEEPFTWRASPNEEGPNAASKYTCSGRAALRAIREGWGSEAMGKSISLGDLGPPGQEELIGCSYLVCETAGLEADAEAGAQKQKHRRDVLKPAELQTVSLETRDLVWYLGCT